ncbi:MAG TPA: MFS transporter [Jatrophihabitans sp.]|nr:MFS transporter [Jatrophihabitans sp.]
MPNLVEAVVPKRLGVGFRRLLAGSWLNNIGDGIAIASGPLLVASLTDSAFLIASGALLQWLPQLVFGLWAGVLSDRADRRLIVVAAETVRAVVVIALCLTIVTGTVTVGLTLVALFVLATVDVFGMNATNTLLPMLVHRDDLAIANARIQAGFISVNQLAGPPIGAALFAAGHAWPFVSEGVLVAVGAIFVSRIVAPARVRDSAGTAVWHDIAEGVRWVRHHAAVRTLVLTIFTFNITFGAAWSVLVIYAKRRLELGEIGFGLIMTVLALGGVLGMLSYGWIVRRLSLGNVMRIGLIIETLTHLGLALATTPWVAMPIFFVFGAHAFIWGTTSITVRQRAVPTELQGRVGSVNSVGVFGGLVIGSGIGGVLAQHLGVTAPFWFAFIGSAVFVVLIWGQLTHIAHDATEAVAQAPSAG